ncbi:MAG: hypothetical protein ACM369_08760, partial [Acidobacteriota bacterium]
ASFVFLPIVLWLCATGMRTGGRRVWLLPAVMVLWVNTHSLFVIGGLIIGCYMAAGVANRLRLVPAAWREPIEPSALRTMLLAGTLALCATLANPYGLRGALLPLKLMTRLSGEAPAFQLIGELRRSFSPEAVNFAVRAYKAFFFFSLAVVGIALLVVALARRPEAGESRSERRRKQRLGTAGRNEASDDHPSEAKRAGFDLAGIAIFAGLAYLSTLARRNMALFALVTAPFVGHCLAALGRRFSPSWKSGTREFLEAAAVVVLLPALVWAGWFVASNNFYRWDAQPLEFGSGVFEVGSPVKASAFVKEQKLSPPLYNDWTSGGYLTWDKPVAGGVYIDSRGEVYDDQFFSNYLDRLRHPAKWQDEADQRGFQTVIFCHWYAGLRPLLTWLLRDPRWMLVYFDENTTVFVRRRGNEWLIEKAIAEFQPIQEKQVRALLEPVSSWQWPVGRARALLAYGNLLEVMGRSREAVPLFERLLEIGQSRKEESWTAVRLGHHYAAIGQKERARAYADRAAQADPDNPDIPPLRKRIGR